MAAGSVRRTDAEIQYEVRAALYADRRVISDNVVVDVRQGVVTLGGSVPGAEQRQVARRIAERIKGVRKVVDDLTVIPLAPRQDADITADVVTALTLDSLVDEDKIEVTTVDGVVYLRGTVGSYTERKAADDDTRSVAGVLDVVDEIVVAPAVVHGDEQLARDIRRQVEESLRIDPASLSVEVRHGVAYLRGLVPSLTLRWIVDELARWTPGITDVVNELQVAPPTMAA